MFRSNGRQPTPNCDSFETRYASGSSTCECGAELLFDLYVVPFEGSADCPVVSHDRLDVIHQGSNLVGLRLGYVLLLVQDETNRGGAQSELPLFSIQTAFRQFPGNLGGFDSSPVHFDLVVRIADFGGDSLCGCCSA